MSQRAFDNNCQRCRWHVSNGLMQERPCPLDRRRSLTGGGRIPPGTRIYPDLVLVYMRKDWVCPNRQPLEDEGA